MGKKQNLLGRKQGRLLVVEELQERSIQGSVQWLCLCDCGDYTTITTKVFNNLAKMSCGCLKKDIQASRQVTHGMSSTPSWNSWKSMLSRCNNPNYTGYEYYGGRGITVCDDWNPRKGGSFENFYEDMGERSEGTTLDRIDVNGSYCKENCRWATAEVQGRNKRIRKDSVYPGVAFSAVNSRWRVRVFHNRKSVWIGQFDTLLDAVCAKMSYDNMVRNSIN